MDYNLRNIASINMNKTQITIGMIGYRPTMRESIMISYIGEVFDLNNCAVIRELISGHLTIDDLYTIAGKTSPNQLRAILPYIKQVCDPRISIDSIVKEANMQFAKDILGFEDPNDRTIWEFIY